VDNTVAFLRMRSAINQVAIAQGALRHPD